MMAIKKSSESYGDLYVPINDISEKRKSLLLSIKDSLLMQEEYEKVLALRRSRNEILRTIKKGMASLNVDYQEIKKFLPNVKNVLSNTEKEIGALEAQISNLKKENLHNLKNIDKFAEIESNLIDKPLSKHVVKEKVVAKKKAVAKKVVDETVKPLTKRERVRNNLKVIEAKLKSL